jgi:hypothetical protein
VKLIAPTEDSKNEIYKAQLQEAQKSKRNGTRILAAEQEKTLCIKQAEEDRNRVIKEKRYNSFTATKSN